MTGQRVHKRHGDAARPGRVIRVDAEVVEYVEARRLWLTGADGQPIRESKQAALSRLVREALRLEAEAAEAAGFSPSDAAELARSDDWMREEVPA